MINIITALQCEAKPLINRYKLKGHNTGAGFRLYENDEMRLIVAGLGKLSSAAACAYLYGRHGEQQGEAWLNIGVAGHATMEIGTPLVAHKITDQATKLSWYPPLISTPPCSTQNIITVDTPSENYVGDGCYEMEAAGFYATASRFSTSELIQCFKVISDNREQPAQQVNEKQVLGLIEENLDLIDQLIKQLQTLSNELKGQQATPAITEDFLAQWHFTSYQKNRLVQLLQRWQALQPEATAHPSDFVSCKKGKDVLASIESKLNEMPINF